MTHGPVDIVPCERGDIDGALSAARPASQVVRGLFAVCFLVFPLPGLRIIAAQLVWERQCSPI